MSCSYLHMAADPEHETHVHTEGPDVCASFAGDPEDHQVTSFIELDELAVVDGPHSQRTLDSRYERGSLEERPCQVLQGPCYQGLAAFQLGV
jgi:hypothetical protein